MTRRRRCQLLLDQETWDRLKADAARRGMSVSALVRDRLAGVQAISQRPGVLQDRPPADPLPDVSSIDQTGKKPILFSDF